MCFLSLLLMPFSTKQNEAENCWHITIKKQITQFLGIKTFNISTKDKYHNFVRSTTAPEYSFLLYNEGPFPSWQFSFLYCYLSYFIQTWVVFFLIQCGFSVSVPENCQSDRSSFPPSCVMWASSFSKVTHYTDRWDYKPLKRKWTSTSTTSKRLFCLFQR